MNRGAAPRLFPSEGPMNMHSSLGITTRNLPQARAAGRKVLETMERAWGLTFTPQERRVNASMGAFAGERIHRLGLRWTLRSIKAGLAAWARQERAKTRAKA